MSVYIDHVIVPVNDVPATLTFYTSILAFQRERTRGPFEVVRVSPTFVLQFAAWNTSGGMHLAFALEPDQFDAAFQRIRDAGMAYGDAFDKVGSMRGPGQEDGARGMGRAVYCFDPSRHLIEIRSYAAPSVEP